MCLTIRVFALGSIMAGSLGCNAQKDAVRQPEPAAQQAQLEKPKPVQPAEPAQPSPPKAAAPAAAADANTLCMQVCRKAEELKCAGSEDCKSGCQELLSMPGCQPAMVSFLECLSKEPLEHWECDNEVHVPAIREGYCEAQQQEIAVCMGSAS